MLLYLKLNYKQVFYVATFEKETNPGVYFPHLFYYTCQSQYENRTVNMYILLSKWTLQ